MQPTYLPWSGYFNLIARSDVFIFLDDVEYSKGSWHNRNQLIISKEKAWITIPVNSGLNNSLLNTVPVYKARWTKKHVATIVSNYGKHTYFSDIKDILTLIESFKSDCLADVNIAIIKLITHKLGLNTKILKSSELNIVGERCERLIKFCHQFECDTYLSPIGAKNYIVEDGVFEGSDVKLVFQDFIPEDYSQIKVNNFISHLSILDIIANIGWENTRDYIRECYVN